LKPEDIGFRLGPRINAIGRIADPEIVISLLTTDDMGLALERANEQINQRRQQLCEQIEQEAIAHFEQSQIDLQQSAYWSLSNRTGITVSLALLPPAWWIAMAFCVHRNL